jgi:hypothetical protein
VCDFVCELVGTCVHVTSCTEAAQRLDGDVLCSLVLWQSDAASLQATQGCRALPGLLASVSVAARVRAQRCRDSRDAAKQ